MSNNLIESNCSDLPAIEDLLGTDKQQSGLVEFMRKCGTPMTIAVQGDWGTGKTSTMKQLQEKLERENGSTLWFPTWQFAVLGEQDRLLIDLLMLLCCKLEEKCSKFDNDKDKETLNKVTRFIKRVGRAAAIGSIYLAAETGKKLTGIDGAKVVDKVIDGFEKQDKENKSDNTSETNITYESYVIQVSELHNDLTTLIDIYLGRNNTNRLYIFIDDLDRLEPLRAVELLEGIKNFLDIPRCVFVIAIDTKVVMEGLKAKYGENMDKDKMVHFFDKIIQVPYKLPVHNYKLEAFMKDVLEGYDEKNAAKYVEFLESADIHNPRTIKRCVNFCMLHHYMDGLSTVSQKDDNVKLHRFAIKMLELENVEIFLKLLPNVRRLKDDYSGLRTWLIEKAEFKDNSLYKNVLDCFHIDIMANDDKIRLFSEYILFAAPDDIISGEIVGYAQQIYDLSNFILQHGGKSTYGDMTLVGIAREINELACYFTEYKIKDCSIRIYYDSSRSIFDAIYLTITGISIDQNILDKYCYEDFLGHNGTKILYYILKNVYYFYNIKDTSSPDAPIYKILQAACVIEIPTELTPIAP